MQKLGYDINGVEISGLYRKVYKNRTGKELYSFNLLEEDDTITEHYEKYDCILLFHTLEHINNPIKFLNGARRLLNKGGG